MTACYNVWTEYFEAQSINARIARDINLLQTINTFFDYFAADPSAYSEQTVNKWLAESDKISTDIGYDLFERIIPHNPRYRKAIDSVLTPIENTDPKA